MPRGSRRRGRSPSTGPWPRARRMQRALLRPAPGGWSRPRRAKRPAQVRRGAEYLCQQRMLPARTACPCLFKEYFARRISLNRHLLCRPEARRQAGPAAGGRAAADAGAVGGCGGAADARGTGHRRRRPAAGHRAAGAPTRVHAWAYSWRASLAHQRTAKCVMHMMQGLDIQELARSAQRGQGLAVRHLACAQACGSQPACARACNTPGQCPMQHAHRLACRTGACEHRPGTGLARADHCARMV